MDLIEMKPRASATNEPGMRMIAERAGLPANEILRGQFKSEDFDRLRDDDKAMAAWSVRAEQLRNRAEVIVAKRRHGPTGTVELFFEPELCRFSCTHRLQSTIKWDRERPFARVDHLGLLWLLKGGAIVELHRDRAVVQTAGGIRQTYWRCPVEVGRVVLAWELTAGVVA
jgi:hypothetical protein